MSCRSSPSWSLGAQCYETALQTGLEASVDLLIRAVSPDTLPCGPGGHAFVPVNLAEQATQAWVGGRIAPRSAGRERRLGHWFISGAKFCAVQHTGEPPEHAPLAPYQEWLLGLSWLRLGLSERLLTACVAYLRKRTAAGGPLLQQQMVKSVLAEAAIGHAQIHTMLSNTDQPGVAAMLSEIHQQIGGVDQDLIQLLGAGGFVTDSAGHVAYISGLLADPHSRQTSRKMIMT